MDDEAYECPDCGATFLEGATECPKCGIQFDWDEADEDSDAAIDEILKEVTEGPSTSTDDESGPSTKDDTGDGAEKEPSETSKDEGSGAMDDLEHVANGIADEPKSDVDETFAGVPDEMTQETDEQADDEDEEEGEEDADAATLTSLVRHPVSPGMSRCSGPAILMVAWFLPNYLFTNTLSSLPVKSAR